MINNKNIFLIEDDINLLSGLQAKLRVEGFGVTADEGAEENAVLEKILTLKPDYIILDIVLPKINGLELLKKIKAKPEISRIPIFVFTDISDRDSRERARKYGADFYLIKTDFNLDEFINKFKKIIANKEKIGAI